MSPVFIGLAIAGGVLTLAVAFLLLQLRERRHRSRALSPEDQAYFRARDARRLGGSVVMILIAAGMAAGLVLDPRRDPATRDAWVVTWAVVLLLVILLLLLAVWDGIALSRYASRHRRLLDRERRSVIDALREHQRPDGAEA